MAEPWRNTKAQRDRLRAKFGGRCAYCGAALDRMQADHLKSVGRVPAGWCSETRQHEPGYMLRPELNVLENMMPACVPCNNHKSSFSLEQWRRVLENAATGLRRDHALFRAAERFGVITANRQPVRFFFETLEEQGS